MIQMFPEPLSGTHKTRGPVMLLGVYGQDTPTGALAVDAEGMVVAVSTEELNIDWRFDFRLGRWVDVGPYEGEDDDTEEAPDDGGEAVPGDIPGAD